MEPKEISKRYTHHKLLLFLVALIFVLTALLVDFTVNQLLTELYRNNQKVSIAQDLSTFRARLEERINSNLYLINGMAAHIAISPSISTHEFDLLAKVLLSKSDSLKNIAAAPDFMITFVYPTEGNEEIIGLDYRSVPAQWPRALAAKETGQMAVAGPLNLVQGGQGLIARIPVYDAKSDAFWGLVSSVIDFEILLEQAGLKTKPEGLELALRGKDGLGESGEVFWGDGSLFQEEAEPITMPVTLPSGSWQMAAIPAGGWAQTHPYYWLIHMVVLLVATISFTAVIYRIKGKQAQQESENQLKAMSEASLDALIMIDARGTILFWNPAAEELFGYLESEVVGKSLHDFVALPEDKEKAKSGLKQFEKTGQGPVVNTMMEMQTIHKSGSVFQVERSVAHFQLRGDWYAVGIVRDITARKKTEKLLTEMATIDALTGLFNRRYFMEQAEIAHRQAMRYHRDLSFLMFDLDHFKRINDTYGHDVGDKVLQEVGKITKLVLRDADIIGRVGGEEFAVVMPETDISSAQIVAERLRLRITEAEWNPVMAY